MDGPTPESRSNIAEHIEGLSGHDVADRRISEDSEETLVMILSNIVSAASEDVKKDERLRRENDFTVTEETGENLLAAVNAWASLASRAVAGLYAPTSPWSKGLAGWSTRVSSGLSKLVKLLLTPLKVAAQALNASSYYVGANFPWGVTVTLGWI